MNIDCHGISLGQTSGYQKTNSIAELFSETFVLELKHYLTVSNKDLSSLINLTQTYISGWVTCLTQRQVTTELNVLTNLLKGRQKLIWYWLHEQQYLSSIEDALQLILIETLRSIRFLPKTLNLESCRRNISYLFTLRLKKDILNTWAARPANPNTVAGYDYQIHLSELADAPWTHYLLYLRVMGYNLLEIAEITHIPRETFYYEERNLWQ